jgi:hypothetical protein
MKTIIRLSLFSITIFFAFSCYPNKKLAEPGSIVLPLSDTITITEGSIVYGLPRTVFTVSVEMGRTIETPGPYAQFASDLLGLNDVIENKNEFWSLESIRVKTHEELDPSEFYVIESNTLFQTNVLALKKEGLILDLNPELFYPFDGKMRTREPEASQFQSFDLGSDEYYHLQRDTAYKRVSVDSAFIRIPYIVEKKKRLPVEQLAERAAKKLMEIREGKHLILTGETNVFPQSDASLNEINRLEKEYTELFTGKTHKEIRTYTFQIIPVKEMIGKPVLLFHFSELTGPVSSNIKGAKTVMAEFIPEQKIKDMTLLNKAQASPDAPKYDKLFYRVPDVVNLKITQGYEVLYSSRRLVYQFGEVIQLPANYIIGR